MIKPLLSLFARGACLSENPALRLTSVALLKKAFQSAHEAQRGHTSVAPLINQVMSTTDWSSEVVAAMEQGDYQRAARVVAAEY